MDTKTKVSFLQPEDAASQTYAGKFLRDYILKSYLVTEWALNSWRSCCPFAYGFLAEDGDECIYTDNAIKSVLSILLNENSLQSVWQVWSSAYSLSEDVEPYDLTNYIAFDSSNEYGRAIESLAALRWIECNGNTSIAALTGGFRERLLTVHRVPTLPLKDENLRELAVLVLYAGKRGVVCYGKPQ